MDTLAKKITDAIDKFYKGFKAQKILKTTEEVEANTNESNLASAVVVGELINDINQQPEWLRDASGKIIGYKTPEGGADSVFPFNRYVIVASNQSWGIYTNGTTQAKSINVTSVAGYQYLTADDFNVNIKTIYGGISDSYVSLVKSYDAATGTLTLSAMTGKDSWVLNGTAPAGRTITINFDIST